MFEFLNGQVGCTIMQMLVGLAQVIMCIDELMCVTASCDHAGSRSGYSPWTVQECLRAG